MKKNSRWYVVQTKTKQEWIAQQNLEDQDFTTYLPQFTIKKLKRGRPIALTMPLFPSYLFIRFDIERDQWRSICGTRGVRQLVTANMERATALPEGFVEELMERADEHGSLTQPTAQDVLINYLPGQQIKIKDGLFEGLTGTCVSNRKDNVLVLLSLLSGNYTLELPKISTSSID